MSVLQHSPTAGTRLSGKTESELLKFGVGLLVLFVMPWAVVVFLVLLDRGACVPGW